MRRLLAAILQSDNDTAETRLRHDCVSLPDPAPAWLVDGTGCPSRNLTSKTSCLIFNDLHVRTLGTRRAPVLYGKAKGSTMKKLVLLLVTLLPVAAFASKSKLSPDLRYSNDDVDVIVQYKVAPQQKHHATIAKHGGQVIGSLDLVQGLVAHLPKNKLATLANDADVAYISPNRRVANHLNNATAAVIANYAWNIGLDGTGIGVAVIDSGIHLVDDLKDAQGHSRIAYSYDSLGGGSDDGYGHGTHVAGIIAGNGKSSTCSNCDVLIRGLAPNVKIINFHALDKSGQGTDASVIKAIDTAIQLKATYKIRVMNLSLGRPVYESYTLDPLCQAVERAWKAGIVVVVAAGNYGRDNSAGTNGYGTITAPGNDPYVITVGAMNTKGTPDRGDDVVASYSSKGPSAIDHIVKPDLVAPGNRIVSLQQSGGSLIKANPGNRPLVTYYQTGTSGSLSDRYYVLSGTSMAAPMVSGAVALLLQSNPALTPDQVKAQLMRTAYKNLPPYTTVVDGGQTFVIQSDIFTVGAGYLDVQATLSSSELAPATSGVAMSPTAYFDATSGNVYIVGSSGALWGSAALWGAGAVWGSNQFTDSQSALWSNGALWGSAALWGSSALWGASGTTGFSALWGAGALWGSNTDLTQSLSTSIKGDD